VRSRRRLRRTSTPGGSSGVGTAPTPRTVPAGGGRNPVSTGGEFLRSRSPARRRGPRGADRVRRAGVRRALRGRRRRAVPTSCGRRRRVVHMSSRRRQQVIHRVIHRLGMRGVDGCRRAVLASLPPRVRAGALGKVRRPGVRDTAPSGRLGPRGRRPGPTLGCTTRPVTCTGGPRRLGYCDCRVLTRGAGRRRVRGLARRQGERLRHRGRQPDITRDDSSMITEEQPCPPTPTPASSTA